MKIFMLLYIPLWENLLWTFVSLVVLWGILFSFTAVMSIICIMEYYPKDQWKEKWKSDMKSTWSN
jgi:predicted MFS family arabinose efflux permease